MAALRPAGKYRARSSPNWGPKGRGVDDPDSSTANAFAALPLTGAPHSRSLAAAQHDAWCGSVALLLPQPAARRSSLLRRMWFRGGSSANLRVMILRHQPTLLAETQCVSVPGTRTANSRPYHDNFRGAGFIIPATVRRRDHPPGCNRKSLKTVAACGLEVEDDR